jgi:hypothetical protein
MEREAPERNIVRVFGWRPTGFPCTFSFGWRHRFHAVDAGVVHVVNSVCVER